MRAAQQFDGSDPAGGTGGGGGVEQRRHWREPVVAAAVLTAAGVSGAAGQRVVRVINISEGGVGMVSPGALSVGTEHGIEIVGRPERSGRIRVVFCRTTHGGFEVGAEYVGKKADVGSRKSEGGG